MVEVVVELVAAAALVVKVLVVKQIDKKAVKNKY